MDDRMKKLSKEFAWYLFLTSCFAILVFNVWWVGELVGSEAAIAVTIVTLLIYFGLFPIVGHYIADSGDKIQGER